ncbi:MAG: DUF1648 domain-containing protein [Planctomycetaceae bacterium]
MRKRTVSLALLLGLTVWAVVQQGLYWPHWPERVATHFGPSGRADGWMNRGSAVLFQTVLQTLFPWLLVAIGQWVGKLPNAVINMPHKEYWLAPERRVESLQWMAGMLSWVAVLMSIFLSCLGHLTYRANITGENLALGPFLVVLLLFLASVFALTGSSLWRFRRPPAERSTR